MVVRADDTYQSLERKVRLATILGTIQSTLTNFQFLSEEWKRNTEEERLLGVSLTGIMDNVIISSKNNPQLPYHLERLRDIARETNEEYAKLLGVQPSVAITCVKPSGTVSQLVDSSSGIHSRFAQYYIRRVRMDKKDPAYAFLVESGVHAEDCVLNPASTAVLSFPMKAPEGAVLENDRTAIEQLELWLTYQRHWCEHKPSVTIYVDDNEWLEVGAWVYKHFDEISGISFLPKSNHTYQQAPYEKITEEEYNKMYEESVKSIVWSNLIEKDDNTEGAQQLACVAGVCEI